MLDFLRELFTTPQGIIAFVGLVGAIGTLVTAIGFYIRTMGRIKHEASGRDTQQQITDGEIVKMQAADEIREREHTRALELMKAKVDAEAAAESRRIETALEAKVEALLKTRIQELLAEREAMQRQLDGLQQQLNTAQQAFNEELEHRKTLEEQVARLQTLEKDLQTMQQKLDNERQMKQAIREERDLLKIENTQLRDRLDEMSSNLADTQQSLIELEKLFNDEIAAQRPTAPEPS